MCEQDFSDSSTFNKRAELKIFSQFTEDFQYLGIFGNAQTSHSQDWVDTIFVDTDKLEDAGEYDSYKKSCKGFISSLEIEILTSQVGLLDQLQDYIVGARVTAVKHDWQYDPSKMKQTFSYYASVSYRQVLPESLETAAGYATLDSIKGNLFYPLQVGSGATSNALMAASAFMLAYLLV